MAYFLGIDLGTTFTAAATWRDGRIDICSLGNRAPAVPSVVLVREDGEILVGDAAARRAATEPQRVAREFKRRIGDPTPLIVGGTPYSAPALTAKLLRSVVAKVTELEGAPPAGIGISHPANWGDFKKDLLGEAVRLCDLDDVATVTEPEAAAINYASQERVEAGSVIAVYDLGGGTFDAAVLRKTADGWQMLGEPEGIERLGGIDFDEAVFHHVTTSLGDRLAELDPEDPAVETGMARLRQDCIATKEALSEDTDAAIPVLLPGIQAEVRITRAEFEEMIRPALADSIGALHRALRSAQVEPTDVAAVLLVGGSSRIPLVGQLVGAEIGRPVAVDAHPKYGIASGAAVLAATQGRAAGSGADAAGAPAGAPDSGDGRSGKLGAAAAGAVAGAALGAGAAALAGRDSGSGTGENSASATNMVPASDTNLASASPTSANMAAGTGGGPLFPPPGQPRPDQTATALGQPAPERTAGGREQSLPRAEFDATRQSTTGLSGQVPGHTQRQPRPATGQDRQAHVPAPASNPRPAARPAARPAPRQASAQPAQQAQRSARPPAAAGATSGSQSRSSGKGGSPVGLIAAVVGVFVVALAAYLFWPFGGGDGDGDSDEGPSEPTPQVEGPGPDTGGTGGGQAPPEQAPQQEAPADPEPPEDPEPAPEENQPPEDDPDPVEQGEDEAQQ